MQFVVFEKFTSAYYTKWQEKSCHILLIIYIKKTTQKGAGAICNLLSCYNFALVLHEIALVFSQ